MVAAALLLLTGCGSEAPLTGVTEPADVVDSDVADDQSGIPLPAATIADAAPILAATWEDSPYDGTANAAQDLSAGTVTEWNQFDGAKLADSGTASRASHGATLTLSVDGSAFEDRPLTCVQVVLVDEDSLTGGSTYVFDQTEPVKLLSATTADGAAPEETTAAPNAPTAPGPDSLAGTFFWTFKSEIGSGWNNSGLFFIDDRLAYQGIPEGGLSPDCASSGTGELFASDFQAGCVNYTYDSNSGAVQVGTNAGTFTDGTLRMGALAFYELKVPTAGSRVAVQLEHKGFEGCGVMPGCTTWTHHLILTEDERFARSTGTIASTGISGGAFTSLTHYPADEHGTYQILPDGQIKFSYANGETELNTIAFGVDDSGAPDPQHAGLLLDDTNFYPYSN